MKWGRLYMVLTILVVITSCSTSNTGGRYTNRHAGKTAVKTKSATVKTTKNLIKSKNSVVKEAYKYLGTPYKYGGTTKTGMDCSGLVINAYEVAGVNMPRISRDQASVGKEIRLKDVKEGDLIFFNTSGSNISHVGIVEKVQNGEVFFIHSSTSKGVIVSSLQETYWNKRFVKATRVL